MFIFTFSAAKVDASIFGSEKSSCESTHLSIKEIKDHQSATDTSQTTGLSFSANGLSEQMSMTATGTGQTEDTGGSHADSEVVITVVKEDTRPTGNKGKEIKFM